VAWRWITNVGSRTMAWRPGRRNRPSAALGGSSRICSKAFLVVRVNLRDARIETVFTGNQLGQGGECLAAMNCSGEAPARQILPVKEMLSTGEESLVQSRYPYFPLQGDDRLSYCLSGASGWRSSAAAPEGAAGRICRTSEPLHFS
jgi:hypothetical protein